MVLFYLPLTVLMAMPLYDFKNYIHFSIPAIVVGLLAYLTSHIGRDGGKRKESKLWQDWGGSPTTQLFRWNNSVLDNFTKLRIHQKMEHLCPIGYPVDENFETANMVQADEIYNAWTKYVLSKTRDTTKFPLLFKENIAYGFRRNLWGLKPYAILLILILMAITYLYFGFNSKTWRLDMMPNGFYIAQLYLLIYLSFWIIKVTKKWIKLVAFSYAERLHESIDLL